MVERLHPGLVRSWGRADASEWGWLGCASAPCWTREAEEKGSPEVLLTCPVLKPKVGSGILSASAGERAGLPRTSESQGSIPNKARVSPVYLKEVVRKGTAMHWEPSALLTAPAHSSCPQPRDSHSVGASAPHSQAAGTAALAGGCLGSASSAVALRTANTWPAQAQSCSSLHNSRVCLHELRTK